MVTFSEMLKEEYWNMVDEQGRQYIDFILNSAMRMQALVKDLMDYKFIELIMMGFMSQEIVDG